ncbi:MAG TPA: hypothetical protein VG148_04600 [Pyrinomonadaceae bacterium]|nr:hypothetical protein [Pyrinomonadaceae bacterium]
MYDTSGTQSVCYAHAPDYNIYARLSWLRAELARGRDARAAARRDREAALALSMQSPRTSAQAYAALGTLLGLLPPAAMFGRFLSSFKPGHGEWLAPLAFCVVMNVICCVVGRVMGSWLGGRVGDPRGRTCYELPFVALLGGLIWGVITGASGGVIVFGIGAVAGVMLAVPVALAGFTVFAPLHRLLSHGGMIEARHLRPLALGVAGAIAALILSPHVFD